MKLFGTDGIRGETNIFPMTADFMVKMGIAIGHYFKNKKGNGSVLLGKDTRLSGYMFQSALEAGLLSTGMDVILLGPIPTSAISILTKKMEALCGIMITASHNPYNDNGIKIFNNYGYKLTNSEQSDLEDIINCIMGGGALSCFASQDSIGKARYSCSSAYVQYIDHMISYLPADICSINRFKIGIDCANGASCRVVERMIDNGVLKNATVIGNEPDGFNINKECGAMNVSLLEDLVVKNNLDVGFAFDGDADRIVVIDECGNTIDGNNVFATISECIKDLGLLSNDSVVTTHWSSLSLMEYMKNKKIEVFLSEVGDRNIMYAMKNKGVIFGGEMSGHYILSDFSSTGDGVFMAMYIICLMNLFGVEKVSDFFTRFCPMYRISKVLYGISNEIYSSKNFSDIVFAAKEKLGKSGRLIVRKSGTERDCIRIMVEGNDSPGVDNVSCGIENQMKLLVS